MFPMCEAIVPLKSMTFLSWTNHPDSSKCGTTKGLLCLFNSLASYSIIRCVSVRNVHHGFGVSPHTRWSRGKFPIVMLNGVIRNKCFHTALRSSSNQHLMSVSATLIWVIISSDNILTLFLYHIAHLELVMLGAIWVVGFIFFLW